MHWLTKFIFMVLLPLTPVLQINILLLLHMYVCVYTCVRIYHTYLINKHVLYVYMCVYWVPLSGESCVLCPPKEMFGHNKRVHQSFVLPSLSVH